MRSPFATGPEGSVHLGGRRIIKEAIRQIVELILVYNSALSCLNNCSWLMPKKGQSNRGDDNIDVPS